MVRPGPVLLTVAVAWLAMALLEAMPQSIALLPEVLLEALVLPPAVRLGAAVLPADVLPEPVLIRAVLLESVVLLPICWSASCSSRCYCSDPSN